MKCDAISEVNFMRTDNKNKSTNQAHNVIFSGSANTIIDFLTRAMSLEWFICDNHVTLNVFEKFI